MARRKKYTIPAKSLPIYNKLVEALLQDLNSADFDMNTIQITVLKNKEEPKIQDPKQAYKNLERFIQINGDKDVLKVKLHKIMKVTRPTLDKWIADGFIIPTYTKGEFDYWKYFNLRDVGNQLQKLTK